MDWSDFDGRWFAIQTRCRCEFGAELALLNKGYCTYIPVPRSSANASALRPKPLFPGYLFCRYEKRISSPILGTHGVIRVIGQGISPIPVDDWEIEGIRTACCLFESITACTYTADHPSVTICGGPLSGIRGVFLRSQSSSRLILSIHLLQRSVQIELPTSDVVLCNGSTTRAFAVMHSLTFLCCKRTSPDCPENCHWAE
jgi:hypothetical protein